MELCNTLASCSTELFPADTVSWAVGKPSWILHNEVIRKVVTAEVTCTTFKEDSVHAVCAQGEAFFQVPQHIVHQ